CNSFRSTYNSGVLGSVLTVRVVPFTVSVIEAIAAPSVVASLNVVLPDRRTFPKTSLERILERYAMALEEGSGRPLRGDDGLGVIHARLDFRCFSAHQVDLGLVDLIQS